MSGNTNRRSTSLPGYTIHKGSLKARLAGKLLIAAALLSVLLYFAFTRLAEQIAESTHDNILAASALSIAETIQTRGERIDIDIPYNSLAMLGSINNDRVFYRVVAHGETLTGYEDLPLPFGRPNANTPLFYSPRSMQHTLRAVAVSRTISHNAQPVPFTVVVAQSTRTQQQQVSRFAVTAGILGIGFFFLAATLSLLAAHHSLKPLNQLVQQVKKRGPDDLRPIEEQHILELTPLSRALNSFMRRLYHTQKRTEEFIGEAAHRIRNPLATLRTETDNLLHQTSDKQLSQGLHQIIQAVDESARSADQILDHALVNFRRQNIKHTRLDLTQVVQEVVRSLTPIANMHDIKLQLLHNGEANLILGDTIMLHSAIRNLVENAIKYSPPEGEITLRLQKSARSIILQVLDRGKGLPDKSSQLVKPFKRGKNSTAVSGVGLGLTIVREVARAHKGALSMRKRSGGGTCASLRFSLV